jgi:hypothetical protein
MAKRKKDKKTKSDYKTLNRNLNIEQHGDKTSSVTGKIISIYLYSNNMVELSESKHYIFS